MSLFTWENNHLLQHDSTQITIQIMWTLENFKTNIFQVAKEDALVIKTSMNEWKVQKRVHDLIVVSLHLHHALSRTPVNICRACLSGAAFSWVLREVAVAETKKALFCRQSPACRG